MAIEANKWLRTIYKDVEFDPRYSYNFEIIYPENRIVVDYGDKRGLVLLAVMDNETRREKRIYSEEFDDLVMGTGIKRVKIYSEYSDLKEIMRAFKDEKNFEGFVVHFIHNNFRVKMKLDWYKQISYVMQNFTKKTIWKMFRDGKDVAEIVKDIDDEFYPMVKVYVDELTDEYNTILKDSKLLYDKFIEYMNDKYHGNFTEKWFAIELNQFTENKWDFGCLMLLHKNRVPSKMIWSKIEPVVSTLDLES
jgi:RNA ligase